MTVSSGATTTVPQVPTARFVAISAAALSTIVRTCAIPGSLSKLRLEIRVQSVCDCICPTVSYGMWPRFWTLATGRSLRRKPLLLGPNRRHRQPTDTETLPPDCAVAVSMGEKPGQPPSFGSAYAGCRTNLSLISRNERHRLSFSHEGSENTQGKL